MAEERAPEQGEASDKAYSDSWREVGDNFKSLGESLAGAFKDTWGNEEVRQKLRVSMDSLAAGINQAVKEATDSEQGQQVRDGVQKAAKSAQDAGTQTFRDLKPHIVSSLRQLSSELQRMVDRLERDEAESATDDTDVT